MAIYSRTRTRTEQGIPAPSEEARGGQLIASNTGAYWQYPGAPNTATSAGWRYRSIFTHGYLAAGYKGSNAWRAINKTWHQTDTTLYCGEQLDREGSYMGGVWSDHNAYLENNGHTGSGTNLSSYSLSNGQTRKITTTGGFSSSGVPYGYEGYDPLNEGLDYGTASYGGDVGGWNFSSSRGDSATASGIKTQEGLFAGDINSTTTNNLHFATEIMYSGPTSPGGGGSSNRGTGASGENVAWLSNGAQSNYSYNWTTRTYGAGGTYAYSTDGQCKIMDSKWGHHYCGTGSNVSIGQDKFSDSNGAVISSPNKNHSNGEENQEMGQDWGYTMGDYNGQQNNWTIKYDYATDAQTTMGAACMPKGHYGQSSGYCSTGAASVCDVGVS